MAEDIQKDKKEEDEDKKKAPEEDELTRCAKEREEYLDGWKRAKAELINYKKDEIKRFEEVLKFGQESLIREFLAVLDSFDLALVSESVKNDSKSEKGLYLIRQQLEDILKKNGLERITVKIGEVFNPVFHEAISQVESDKSPGTIIEEVERGYSLNGKIIRPARVKIAK